MQAIVTELRKNKNKQNILKKETVESFNTNNAYLSIPNNQGKVPLIAASSMTVSKVKNLSLLFHLPPNLCPEYALQGGCKV